MDLKLNIFTLNCWGIPFVSKNRKERMQAIAKYLSKGNHNVVCLQEIWSENDFLFIKNEIKNILPYSHYFYSGVLGSGLCVFSAWVIEDVFFHQWPLNGYVHKVHHGDWFGGKGVGLCRIRIGEWLLNVYCTHLHAEYHADDMYLVHRTLQAYSTAEFVKLTRGAADITLLAGDLNIEPNNLSYSLIVQIPSLTDPFNVDGGAGSELTLRASGTCCHGNNSYSNQIDVEKLPEGKRIDHILYQTRPGVKAEVLNFGNPLPERVPGHPFSYSDHNAVSFEVKLSKLAPDSLDIARDEDVKNTLKDAIDLCNAAKSDLRYAKKMYLLLGGFIFMCLLGSVGYWTHSMLHDSIRTLMVIWGFYCIVMGTLWNMIEVNSLKAGLTSMQNLLNVVTSKEQKSSVKVANST